MTTQPAQTPRRRRRVRGVLGSLMVVAIGVGMGGAASAIWTAGGSGTGAGQSDDPIALTLSAGTPQATLFPGGETDVVLTAANPNASSVAIRSLILNTSLGTGGFAVDGGHSGCALAALSLDPQTNNGAGWTVPGASGPTPGSTQITLIKALAMDVGAAAACQGATFTIYLTAAA